MAEDYLNKHSNVNAAANSLVAWQTAKTGTSGFVTGLGGLITLPVAVPADLAATMYVNIRMVAVIAHMNGFDIKSDQVKTAVYITLVGDAAIEAASKMGLEFGNKFCVALIKKIPGDILKQINKMVGFRLVTKFGEKGVVNIAKIAPIIGGVVGGGVNVRGTGKIGKLAIDKFSA